MAAGRVLEVNSEAKGNMSVLPCLYAEQFSQWLLQCVDQEDTPFGLGDLHQTREPELSEAPKPCSEPRPASCREIK